MLRNVVTTPNLGEQLRTKTKAAILEGERKKREKEASIVAKREADLLRWRVVAKGIAEGIPAKCGEAAENSRYDAFVHKLTGEDFISGNKYETADWTKLNGVAAILWNWCKDAGLQPELRANWDGGGMDSWTELWVKW